MEKRFRKNWKLFLIVSLTLGLAPFNPPHIVGKIQWILGGNAFSEEIGMQLQDWFDVLLHGTPWVLLLISIMLNLFKEKLSFIKEKRKYINTETSVWCIVGNIIDEHMWGEEKIIKKGTKHFPPKAKVYCFPEFGGMAHESVRVLGIPRKRKEFINVIIKTELISNFRLTKVYKPKIKSFISEHIFYKSINNDSDLESMLILFQNLSAKQVKNDQQ